MTKSGRLENWMDWVLAGLVGLTLFLCPLFLGATEHTGRVVLMSMAAATLMLSLLRLWIQPGIRLFLPPATVALLAFLVWVLSNIPRATALNVAIQEFYILLSLITFFFVVITQIHKQDYVFVIVGAILLVASLNAFYGIYQFITQSDKVWWLIKPKHFIGRGSGTYFCPNHYVGFLEMAFGLGLGYTLAGRMGIVARLLFGYGTLVIAAGIAVSVSRGGWIATGISAFVFFFLLVRNPRFRWPAMGLLLVLSGIGCIAAFNMEGLKERFTQLAEGGTVDDVRSRIWIWQAAWQMWMDQPWLGFGPGQFDVHFQLYRPKEIQWAPLQVHNDYLNILTDFGIVGFALLTVFSGAVLWGTIRCWGQITGEQTGISYATSNRLALGIGCITGLSAILVHAMVDFNFYIPANALLALVLVALLSTLYRYRTSRFWWTPKGVSKWVCTLVGMIVATALIHESVKQTREIKWLKQARQATSLEKAIGNLEKAYQINPLNDRVAYGIGERLRMLSWKEGPTYREQAELAIRWFERGIAVNPLNRHCNLGIGMCLDWLGKHQEAEAYYLKALKTDPNNHWLLAHTGRHYLYIDDYDTARGYFEKSLSIQWWENPIATSYMNIISRRIGDETRP